MHICQLVYLFIYFALLYISACRYTRESFCKINFRVLLSKTRLYIFNHNVCKILPFLMKEIALISSNFSCENINTLDLCTKRFNKSLTNFVIVTWAQIDSFKQVWKILVSQPRSVALWKVLLANIQKIRTAYILKSVLTFLHIQNNFFGCVDCSCEQKRPLCRLIILNLRYWSFLLTCRSKNWRHSKQ